MKKIKKISSSKNNFLLFSTSLAAAVFPTGLSSQYRESVLMVARNDWSECGGLPRRGQDLCSACGHLEVRPEVILRKD